MVEITLGELQDWDGLAAAWRSLEARAAGSFFQSWTWVGCLARERYPDPVLLQASTQGRVVALALCNRRGSAFAPATLWLGESGDPERDSIYTEHNGPLIEAGYEAVLPELLAAAAAAPIVSAGRQMSRRRAARSLVVSGIDDSVLAAASAGPATVHLRRSRPAPFVDLKHLAARDYVASLGASTRYQLRRSARRYAEQGPITLTRAADVAEALEFLDRLAALHQASWRARGRPGAFASPFFVRFHQGLIRCGLPRGEIDVLRINAGTATIGYLYNFRFRGWIANYQSGFDYVAADGHCKPGLTCRQCAIEAAQAEGLAAYDFLAGEDRYKSSLSNRQAVLHWIELTPPRSVRGLLLTTASRTKRIRNRLKFT